MSARRGFTLIEMMVALALAGLVVAGAFQMHQSFNRQSRVQQQVAEVQQTLRVAMQVLERAVRSAGDGLPPTHTFPTGCTVQTYYGFQFSDSNVFDDPITSFPTLPANTPDADPDWFRVVAADDDGGVVYFDGNGVNISFVGAGTQKWNVGDLFMVEASTSNPNCYAAPYDCSQPYDVTSAFSGSTAWTNPGSIRNQHGQGCGNAPPGNDTCLSGSGRPKGCPGAGPGAILRHFSGGGTVYRIMTPADQGDSGGWNALVSPKLTMRTAPFGTSFGDNAHPWIPIADNIEDMQIAIIGADGTVCNADDTPAGPPYNGACSFANAAWVRITLVARSSQPMQGVPRTAVGGYEDEPSTMPPASSRAAQYLRRSLTATIQLRSYR